MLSGYYSIYAYVYVRFFVLLFRFNFLRVLTRILHIHMLLARRWWCGRHFLFSGNNSGAREKERVPKVTRFFTANALWCSPRGGVGGLRRGVNDNKNNRKVKTLSKMDRGIKYAPFTLSMHPCSNALSFAKTTKSVCSFCARRTYFHRPRRRSFRFFSLLLARARETKTALYF
jgi:hypothetical protein